MMCSTSDRTPARPCYPLRAGMIGDGDNQLGPANNALPRTNKNQAVSREAMARYRPAQGIRHDGGLADLLAEGMVPAAPVRRCGGRSSPNAPPGDTYNSLKLERELNDQGIPLLRHRRARRHYRDQPHHHSRPPRQARRRGMVPAAIERKTWKGLTGARRRRLEHWPRPLRIPARTDPAPQPGQGRPRACKHPASVRLDLHRRSRSTPGGWRDKLGINAITTRLNADPHRYPPADLDAGWSIGGDVAAMLRNPSTPNADLSSRPGGTGRTGRARGRLTRWPSANGGAARPVSTLAAAAHTRSAGLGPGTRGAQGRRRRRTAWTRNGPGGASLPRR